METPLTFGTENHLVGIVSRPDHRAPGDARTGATGVVFMNAGIEHRVGPKGLYTGIARALTDAGFATIRFDYSGMGESRKPARPGSADHLQETLSECTAAADTLAAQAGCRQFVVCGLCSGADDAHRMAVHDERVVGAILIDGYGYVNWRFYLTYYRQRIFSPRRWGNFFRRVLGRGARAHRGVDDNPSEDAIDDLYFFAMPRREQLAGQLRELVARRVRLCYLYSGETREYYNYESQFQDAFADVDFAGCLTEHYIPQADHTFSRVGERLELIRRINAWMQAAIVARGSNR